MPAWRLQDTTERFTDSCGVCAAGREHPAMASPSWSLSTPNPKLLGPGGRRWRLHLSLSGNAVPIVWLPETATRSSGHPFQNRSYCRVVLGSFPIRPPADFGLAFASNLFDWKCYNCGDVAWALRSLGAAIASVWVCVCVCLSVWLGRGQFVLYLLFLCWSQLVWKIWSHFERSCEAETMLDLVQKLGRPAVAHVLNLMSVAASLRDQHHHWHHRTTYTPKHHQDTTQTPPTARTMEHHRDFTEARPWPKGGRPSDERRCPRERLNESSGRRFSGGTRILGNVKQGENRISVILMGYWWDMI